MLPRQLATDLSDIHVFTDFSPHVTTDLSLRYPNMLPPEWRKRKRLEAALFMEVEAEAKAVMKKLLEAEVEAVKRKSMEAEAEAVKA